MVKLEKGDILINKLICHKFVNIFHCQYFVLYGIKQVFESKISILSNY